MKFIVGRTVLLNVLNICAKSTNNGFVIASSSYRFKMDNSNELEISACNMSTSISKTITVDSNKPVVDMLIPAEQLKKFITLLPDQPVEFESEQFLVKDQIFYNITIKTSSDSCKLIGNDGTHFPFIKTSGSEVVNIQFSDLQIALERTAYAMAVEDIEKENKLSAIHVEFSSTDISFATFNGASFALFKIPGNFKVAEILLPPHFITLITGLTLKGDCEVTFNADAISIKVDGFTIKSRLKDGGFVDWKSKFKPLETYISFNRHEFMSCIKRVLLFSNKFSCQVALTIDGNNIKIKGEDIDFNYEAVGNVACTEMSEPMTIGLNGNYTLEALNRLSSDEVFMYLDTPLRPVQFKETIDNENFSLLAPVMLNSYSS